MNFRLLILVYLVVSSFLAYGQVIKGKVYGLADNNKEILSGAKVRWLASDVSTYTNKEGLFEIGSSSIKDKVLLISYTGYFTDTLKVNSDEFLSIYLKPNLTLEEITVEEKTDEKIVSELTTTTEVVTQKDLKKAACCDLTGCFESNSSVDISVTDVITDSKQLKMLGLDGVYTETLVNGIPTLSGLSLNYGLSNIPGTLISNIFITKGTNSVLQGYQSIGGIVDVRLKEPLKAEKLFLNAYTNSYFEKQFNANLLKTWKSGLSILTAFHTVQEANRIDYNNDGFLDLPLITRYFVYSSLLFESNRKFSNDFSLKYANEDRVGGQKNFDVNSNLGSNLIYGQVIKTNRIELNNKLKYNAGKEKDLLFNSFFSFHKQDSYYGTTKYLAKQYNFWGQLYYEALWKGDNILKAGLSYKYQDLKEEINFFDNLYNKTYSGNYDKRESVPGIFIENTFNFLEEDLVIIPGIRYDYHNFYHSIITPRLLAKYLIGENTTLRATIGTGYRVANIFTENLNLLSSSKNILIPNDLKIERALSAGISLTQDFKADQFSGNINIEFYRTSFNNQVTGDYTTIPYEVRFYNLDGQSVSNSFQVEFSLNAFKQIDFKAAYNYLGNYYYKEGVKENIPFIYKHKLSGNLSYETIGKDWLFSTSLQYFGKQKLPTAAYYPVEYQRPDYSNTYFQWNGQVSKTINNYEIYIGVENILNYTQSHPIIDASNPFSRYFDTSLIWGPTKGREFYIGARFKIY